MFASQYQLYGRKIQLVKIAGHRPADRRGRGEGRRRQGGQAAHVFAVIGGPAQAQSFSARARGQPRAVRRHVLDRRARSGSSRSTRPTSGRTSPSPEQTSRMLVAFIKQQLAGKPAHLRRRPRVPDQDAHVRARELRHQRRPVQGVVGRHGAAAEGRGRSRSCCTRATSSTSRSSRRPRTTSPSRSKQANATERDLHRRPDHAAVLHGRGDRAELPPRMDHGRNGVRRHERVRPDVRPEPVGARVRAATSRPRA